MSLFRTSRSSLRRIAMIAAGTACLGIAAESGATESYTLFESGQVRPLALSASGNHLFALNTPDGRLEVFRITPGGLEPRGSVSVGLEPVAVAVRNNAEVWVVNHLSDSVSVVDVSNPRSPRVTRTLLVGDEPRDIVFAGPMKSRAFVTTAHRGQNVPYDPQPTTPGVGRADVWVFDANTTDATLGGSPLAILNLFTDTPRALAVSPDGAKVYAAGFHSGNRTTAVQRWLVQGGGGMPAPTTNYAGVPQPGTSLIAQFDGTHWKDAEGGVWDSSIRFSLPDHDVFTIDANASTPSILAGETFSGVGTTLYAMAVNPASGKVYVANTEALNVNRFEGPGTFAGTTVRGHFVENRITVLSGTSVLPRHLNKHVNYATCCAPLPNVENARSLALPVALSVTQNGQWLAVAAMGSDKVAVYNTAAIENDTFVPSTANQIPVSGGGPTGIVLDEPRLQMYVLTRFDNGISVIDALSREETHHVTMHNPEPAHVVEGREFLYDARFTSSHGDSACASCHTFGDMDSLAWDLGNPDADPLTNPGPFVFGETGMIFDPMKGPLTTQSLRGMANHGSMHWRGDRTGGNDAPTAQPDSGSHDERAAFEKFQAGFVGLLGRSEPLAAADMEAFTDFVLELTYPPNPNRNLDDSLTADQQAGRDQFLTPNGVLPGLSCEGCHTTDPAGNAAYGVDKPGFFGTSGFSIPTENILGFKIPHLRNLYQKVGMFGLADTSPQHFPGDNGSTGDQVRGFGFAHDGAVDTIFRHINSVGFEQSALATEGFLPGAAGVTQRRQVEQYILAFDSNLKPIVGQQVTLRAQNEAAAGPRIDLLLARASAGDCDVIAKVTVYGQEIGLLYVGGGSFTPSLIDTPSVSDALLRQVATSGGRPVTYTAVPPGSGHRMALDRDEDGVLDGDEDDLFTSTSSPD
jgi:YVTN family beta-propeller protein